MSIAPVLATVQLFHTPAAGSVTTIWFMVCSKMFLILPPYFPKEPALIRFSGPSGIGTAIATAKAGILAGISVACEFCQRGLLFRHFKGSTELGNSRDLFKKNGSGQSLSFSLIDPFTPSQPVAITDGHPEQCLKKYILS